MQFAKNYSIALNECKTLVDIFINRRSEDIGIIFIEGSLIAISKFINRH